MNFDTMIDYYGKLLGGMDSKKLSEFLDYLHEPED